MAYKIDPAHAAIDGPRLARKSHRSLVNVNNMAANVITDVLNDGLRSRATFSSDKTPLLEDEEEQTAFTDDVDRGEDPSLPFGGKVYLARRKKPDTWFTFFLEVGRISVVTKRRWRVMTVAIDIFCTSHYVACISPYGHIYCI